MIRSVLGLVTLAMMAGAAHSPAQGQAPWTSPAGPVDHADALGGNVSGLVASGPTTLWAVRDRPSTLLALDLVDEQWVPRPGWEDGRQLRSPRGGSPDAEAVTISEADVGAVYVGAERDNDESNVSRNSILRYEISATATATGGVQPAGVLRATDEWRLDDVLPTTGPNSGVEGLAWIPDDLLVASGLPGLGGEPYVPPEQPAFGGGLLAVGTESDGDVRFVALDEEGAVTLVTTVSTGLPAVMELTWSPQRGELWAMCDNGCGGELAVLRLGIAGFDTPILLSPPPGMEVLNNEGFALVGVCDAAEKLRAVWSDDSATNSHALRATLLGCQPLVAGAPVQDPTTTATDSDSESDSESTSASASAPAPESASASDEEDSVGSAATLGDASEAGDGAPATAENSSSLPIIVAAMIATIAVIVITLTVRRRRRSPATRFR